MILLRKLALLAFMLAAFALAWPRLAGWQPVYGFRVPDAPVIQSAAPLVEPPVRKRQRQRRSEDIQRVPQGRFETHFVSGKLHTQTHAASLVELKDGRVRAFWFSGSREGAADVTINSAVFDTASSTWGAEQVVASRDSAQRALHRYIAKVGNPVAARAVDGSLWLFYVTVSLGGWAGSSITLMVSHDDGESWDAPRRLVTSPFINISTLVKSPPFFYADGSMGLPVYHEFASKFAEILRLDAQGRVLDKQRLTPGSLGTLQPVVLIGGEREASVLMRYSGAETPRRVIGTASHDGGQSWDAPRKLPLQNPNAALSALVLPDGKLLAALNDQEQGRDSLSLQVSADGGASWRELRRLEEMGGIRNKPLSEAACLDLVGFLVRNSDPRLEQADLDVLDGYVQSARPLVSGAAGCHFEFSYPYLIQAHNGDIHLAYTWNRTFIKHVMFDHVWLRQHLQEHAE